MESVSTNFKSIKKKFKETSPSRVIIFFFLSIYALSMIFSLCWVILASLKSHTELTLTNVSGLPEDWLFSNYALAFEKLGDGKIGLIDMFVNSVWYSIGNAVISLFVCSMSAYVFSKYDFPGKKFLYAVFMVAMMLPIYGSFPANFKLTKDLGIYDSPLMLVTAAAGYGSTMLMLMSGFDTLSWGYAEAAEIDGAGHFTIFFKIMLPLMKPVLSSLFIIGLISAWNNYMTPITYLPNYPTISSGLYIFKDIAIYSMNIPAYYAGVVMSFIPTLIMFIFFKNKIIENVAIGGIKG